MDWYSEACLQRRIRVKPAPSNMSPGMPRATVMIPRMSGDKASTGGRPTPRSIDLKKESNRSADLQGELGVHPPNFQTQPDSHQLR